MTRRDGDEAAGSAERADDRWAEVEAALAQSEPELDDWAQATAWVRDRDHLLDRFKGRVATPDETLADG